jgi:hypothetical protein
LDTACPVRKRSLFGGSVKTASTPPISKSFLLLFFKKEALACLFAAGKAWMAGSSLAMT